MVKRIGIFGHVGNQNLGDEAIITAVIQNIRRRHPDAEIYGFTINPEDTQERHKIPAFPIRRARKIPHLAQHEKNDQLNPHKPDRKSKLPGAIKVKLQRVPLIYALLKGIQRTWRIFLGSLEELRFLAICYKNLKGTDLLIIAGSQQLIDFIGGPWTFPYTFFKWSLIARIVNTKVAFVSVGAGPVRSSLGKFLIRKSLSLASYRSYRDQNSREFIEQINVPGQNLVFPDLVYSLRIDARPINKLPGASRPIVGINPVPFFDSEYWPGSSADLYEAYVRNLAGLASWLIQRGYAVLFFPTQLRADPPVINDIRNMMKCSKAGDFDRKIIEQSIHSFDDLVSTISMTDIVVATRFHGIVISYLLNKPVLGIAYHKKSFDLMAEMGQSDYAMDIRTFDLNTLQKRFLALESCSTLIREEIGKRIQIYRQTLEIQYDRVLAL